MRQTIFAILTNKAIRNNSTVEKILDREFVVGAPWRGDANITPPPAKTNIVS